MKPLLIEPSVLHQGSVWEVYWHKDDDNHISIKCVKGQHYGRVYELSHVQAQNNSHAIMESKRALQFFHPEELKY